MTARRREIREATQGYGETLGRYCNRYQSLLEACPNHNLKEVEIYSKFYDGMDVKGKDLVNSSSGGSFYKLRLSKAKIVLKKLLTAKREYGDAEEPSMKEKMKSTPTDNMDNLLESRIDKLEEALQSVIQSRQCSAIPIQTHFQAKQVNHHQSAGEFWNANEGRSPEGQSGVYQQEYSYGGEWNRAEEHQSFQPYTEPYPISTQTLTWPIEHPSYQPYSEYQSYEFYPPTYQPDYSNHHPSYTQFYPDQTCPDQPQYQPHPQQSCEPTSEENHRANSAAGEIEGVTAVLQNVRSCTKSEAETIMDMQHTYEEQQFHMDNMIKQVTLLADMITEVKENKAKSEIDGSAEMEEGVMRAEEKEPADTEEESEAMPEEKETEEIESDEERVQTDEKSIITPPENDVSKEILEEERDESHGNEETIERGEKIDDRPFYLQPDEVHAPKEKVEEFTIMVKEESTPAEEPPQVIDQSEGCSYEKEEPEWKEEERIRRKAARAIYWVQLQPWPESREIGKPPHSGVRPRDVQASSEKAGFHVEDGCPENQVDNRRKSRVRIPKV